MVMTHKETIRWSENEKEKENEKEDESMNKVFQIADQHANEE